MTNPEQILPGFIGLGVMGKAMARNILKSGFPLTVHNRSPESVEELVGLGAKDGGSAAGVAAASNIIMLCLPDTPDVEAILFNPNGVADAARPGTILVDCSTISPGATVDFAARLSEKGVFFIDSPVSGGPKGAQDGVLSCMLGGDAAAVERAMPVLKAIGTKHVHLGAAGAGQLVKACNQLVIAMTLTGISEAVALCLKSGVDPYAMRDALLGGSAQSFVLQNHCKRLLDGALAPGFRSSLLLKDLKLALEAGRALDVFMPGTALGAQLLTALCNSEHKDLDSAALGLLIQDLSGISKSPRSDNAAE